MQIQLNPQVIFNSEISQLSYQFVDETIHVTLTYNNVTYKDSYDFSGFSDGILRLYSDVGEPTIETDLPINPLLGAKRENGKLFIELYYPIGSEAHEDEVFPKEFSTKDIQAVETSESVLRLIESDTDALEESEGKPLEETEEEPKDTPEFPSEPIAINPPLEDRFKGLTEEQIQLVKEGEILNG